MNIQINSSGESKENNHIFLQLKVDWPAMYPEIKPVLHLKNMVPDLLDNNHINAYEEAIENKLEELVGMPMMFEICDMIREEIAELNAIIVGHERAEEVKQSVESGL